jgi:3-oxoadipate CoA-transferase beta subunit
MKLPADLARQAVAWRAAQDLRDGSYDNLGVGMPADVSRFVPADVEVVFQSENGILGMGPRANDRNLNRNLVNASQQFVTVLPGASYFDCCESFAMLRGGHVDVALLGAYEVTQAGDLANWDRGDPRVPPAVGGAMDIAVGARAIWVLMEHLGKDGRPRLVRSTALPLTGTQVVRRVYTDLAVIEVAEGAGVVHELRADIGFAELQRVTDWELVAAPDCRALRMPDWAREGGRR